MLLNRDLSWLGFNYRILQEAADPAVPLYERLKFLSIFSSNLDEFFRVRYPAVFAFTKLPAKTLTKAGAAGMEEVAPKIQSEINRQLDVFGAILTADLIPALLTKGVHFYYKAAIRPEHIYEVREIFLSRVLSFIQPVFLEGEIAKKFVPENSQLYFVVVLKNKGEVLRHAVINIPSDRLSRFFTLTPINDVQYVIFIDDIIRENLACVFPGLSIEGVYSIKFNRDAELNLTGEYEADLLIKIEKQLQKRDFGPPSRFLYSADMPRNVQLFLAAMFNLSFEEMFEGGRYHHLSDLNKFPLFSPALLYPKHLPIALPTNIACGDIFKLLDNEDMLLHLPYHSYNTVLSFFNQCAIDAQVTDIFITLYRVASESHIVNALISAAKNGKKVTVCIELKARFDEANNIKWSRRMKEAGIKLIYSQLNIKVHAKITLVHKRTDKGNISYAAISTGNFNETTAQFYTDHVLMTTDKTIIAELDTLCKYLRKDKRHSSPQFTHLLVSQFNMNRQFTRLIEQEIEKAQLGKPSLIRIKVNNLEEPTMINLLYKASEAGVNVQLYVRSICCLVPGVPKQSERIVVKRLVDRFLEHSRLFIFGADNPTVIMGSADWMTRNLHHRIEVCVPVTNAVLSKQLIDYFDTQWNDTDKAVELNDGFIGQKVTNENIHYNAQDAIYAYLKTNNQFDRTPIS